MVVVVVRADRRPHEIQLRHLHAVLVVEALLRVERHGRRLGPRDRLAARDFVEVLLDPALRGRRIEVARHDERRVVRRVVQPEELLHVIDGRGGQILHAADDRPGVGVARRVDCRADQFAGAPIGLVVHALSALVLHDFALRVVFRHVERIEQPAHLVGLDPQLVFQVVRRHLLEVRRRVVARAAVVLAANAFREPVLHAVGHVRGAGEHHVLEQVGETRSSHFLVLRPHVVHHQHRYGGRRVVLGEHDRQAVRQRVFLERDVERGRRGGLPCTSQERRQASGHARGDEQQAK